MHRTADIEFTVSLTELKRAFRRLSARLPDESEAGGEIVVFTASDDKLEITANETQEGLSASVVHPGRASVPFPFFWHCQSLRVYRQKTIRFAFSAGVLRMYRTALRHPSISVYSTSVLRATDDSAVIPSNLGVHRGGGRRKLLW